MLIPSFQHPHVLASDPRPRTPDPRPQTPETSTHCCEGWGRYQTARIKKGGSVLRVLPHASTSSYARPEEVTCEARVICITCRKYALKTLLLKKRKRIRRKQRIVPCPGESVRGRAACLAVAWWGLGVALWRGPWRQVATWTLLLTLQFYRPIRGNVTVWKQELRRLEIWKKPALDFLSLPFCNFHYYYYIINWWFYTIIIRNNL